MRTVKSELGFGYPVHKACQMCGKYKATVCIQRFAPIPTCQINWIEDKNNIFYCVGCNMEGDGRVLKFDYGK
jgi:hypothetical protein